MDTSRSDFVKTLRRLPLFTDLSEVELALIAESVSRIYFDEGSFSNLLFFVSTTVT
jgi:hypothetical protein